MDGRTEGGKTGGDGRKEVERNLRAGKDRVAGAFTVTRLVCVSCSCLLTDLSPLTKSLFVSLVAPSPYLYVCRYTFIPLSVRVPEHVGSRILCAYVSMWLSQRCRTQTPGIQTGLGAVLPGPIRFWTVLPCPLLLLLGSAVPAEHVL